MKNSFSVFKLIVCLVVSVGLILGCFPQRVEAVAVTGSLVALGVAACMILFSAGVVFNPRTVSDIQAIGQNFQLYLTEWGEENDMAQEVDEAIESIVIVSPFFAPPGDDGDDDGWESPIETKVKLANGILAGISLWVSSTIFALNRIPDNDAPCTPDGYFGFSGLAQDFDSIFWMTKSLFEAEFPFWDFLRLAYVTSSVMILGVNSYDMRGFYFDSNGILQFGRFENPYGESLAKYCGMYSLSDLTLIDNLVYWENDPVFANESVAKAYSSFSSSDLYVINWDSLGSSFDAYSSSPYIIIPCYFKKAGDEIFQDGLFDCKFYFANSTYGDEFSTNTNKSYMTAWSGDAGQGAYIDPEFTAGDIVDDVKDGTISPDKIPLYDIDYGRLLPERQVDGLGAIQHIYQQFAGGMSLDDFHEVTLPDNETASRPYVIMGIPSGSHLTYYVGDSPSPISVIAESPDGGTLSYEWYRYGTDANGKAYPVSVLDRDNSFIPFTNEPGTSFYYCRIYNMNGDQSVDFTYTNPIRIDVVPNPNSEDDEDKPLIPEDLPGYLKDAVGDALNDSSTQEEQKINTTGTDVSQQLLNAVPDYSSAFLPSVKNLSDALGYTGTTCVLTLPSIKIPAVGSLVAETVISEEYAVNLEDYFNMLPDLILTLVRSLFDIAIVFFCLRELNSTLSQVFNGFKSQRSGSGED